MPFTVALTPSNCSTVAVMRDFLDFMDHPLLCACWDTAHGNIDLVAREIGQYDNIVALGDKLKGLHIADNFGDCHHHTWPFGRKAWEHNGETVTKRQSPPLKLKKQAVNLLYKIGKYILETYNCFEE